MGQSSSTSIGTQSQSIIEQLGEQYPYSDSDLELLVKTFENLEKDEDNIATNTQFIKTLTHSRWQQHQDHTNILNSVLQILPTDFVTNLKYLLVIKSRSSNSSSKTEFQYSTVEDSILSTSLTNFMDTITALSGRRGSRSVLKQLFRLCQKDDTQSIISLGECAISLCYSLAVAIQLLELSEGTTEESSKYLSNFSKKEGPNSLINSWKSYVNKSVHTTSAFSLKDDEMFMDWATNSVPALYMVLSTFTYKLVFPKRLEAASSSVSTSTSYSFPNLRGEKSAFVYDEMFPLLLFSFSCLSPSLQGSWYRIYSTDHDGLSFNRLHHALLGYGGPTLMIISAENKNGGSIFGAYTSSKWKESANFYGDTDCFLYQIEPSVEVMQPRMNNCANHFMYCNPTARSKGYDGLAHGIGFGGDTDEPRLFISETFEDCAASSNDLTFAHGPLIPASIEVGNQQKYFNIESLEVWGVGGDDAVSVALEARSKQRELVDANIRKARKVDKAQFLDDFKSGVIESKAFQHREQMRGRHDCHIDDEHGGYEYEK